VMRTLQLKTFEPAPAILRDQLPDKAPRTPSEWFSKKFPIQADIYGAPLLEEEYETPEFGDLTLRTKPLALNEDFFAAILGGDEHLGHKVVYYPPDTHFYFFDPREQCFLPTVESKLLTLLSQLLIHCA